MQEENESLERDLEAEGSPGSRGDFIVNLLLAALFALVLAGAELDHFIGDDAGITLRYADRVAEGKGFNYNDGERVNGASAPLWTLALAGALRCGLSPIEAIRSVGIAAAALAFFLVFSTLRRHAGPIGAVAFAVAMLGHRFLAGQFLSGLEPAFTALFIALLFHALANRRRVWTGIALGLLVANKLDGALVPLVFGVGYLITRRRLPIVETGFAVLAYAPVAVLLFLCFGTVVPDSASTKVMEHGARANNFDPWWMWNLVIRQPVLFALACASPLAGFCFTRLRGAVALFLFWTAAFVLLHSQVDFGDPYPWYSAAPRFVLCILAGLGVAGAAESIARIATKASMALRSSNATAVATGIVAIVLSAEFGTYREFVPTPAAAALGIQPALPRYPCSNLARRAAAIWLAENTDGTERLATAWGLSAYHWPGPVYDRCHLNSHREEDWKKTCPYVITDTPQKPPPGYGPEYVLAHAFRYGLKCTPMAVYMHRDSQLARRLTWSDPLGVRPDRMVAISEQEHALVAQTANRLARRARVPRTTWVSPPIAGQPSLSLVGAAGNSATGDRPPVFMVAGAPPLTRAVLLVGVRQGVFEFSGLPMNFEPHPEYRVEFQTDSEGRARATLPAPPAGQRMRDLWVQVVFPDAPRGKTTRRTSKLRVVWRAFGR